MHYHGVAESWNPLSESIQNTHVGRTEDKKVGFHSSRAAQLRYIWGESRPYQMKSHYLTPVRDNSSRLNDNTYERSIWHMCYPYGEYWLVLTETTGQEFLLELFFTLITRQKTDLAKNGNLDILSCSVNMHSSNKHSYNSVVLASVSFVSFTCLPNQIWSPCSITPIYRPLRLPTLHEDNKQRGSKEGGKARVAYR